MVTSLVFISVQLAYFCTDLFVLFPVRFVRPYRSWPAVMSRLDSCSISLPLHLLISVINNIVTVRIIRWTLEKLSDLANYGSLANLLASRAGSPTAEQLEKLYDDCNMAAGLEAKLSLAVGA